MEPNLAGVILGKRKTISTNEIDPPWGELVGGIKGVI